MVTYDETTQHSGCKVQQTFSKQCAAKTGDINQSAACKLGGTICKRRNRAERTSHHGGRTVSEPGTGDYLSGSARAHGRTNREHDENNSSSCGIGEGQGIHPTIYKYVNTESNK
jgi:hypothetical protein